VEARDELIAEALVAGNQGNQDDAIEKVRPLADEGDPAALLAICWLFQQLGQPRITEGIPYAQKATELGNPWPLQWYFPHLADDPATRSQAAAMIAAHPVGGFNANDPIGRAVAFATDGEAARAAEMLRAAAGPHQSPALSPEEIESRVSELDRALSVVNESRATVLAEIQRAAAEVGARRQGLETRANGLELLIDSLTDGSTRSYFDRQAKKSATASLVLWCLGVLILLVAAGAAFLPLILNYTSDTHELHGQSNISAHLGATLALAAVAGVLLARARSRDQSGQHSNNLSIALGTIYTYSEQMENEEARERFKHDMTRLVLENFLEQKPHVEDGRRSVLTDIASTAEPQRQPNPE
jgi:hypothetical protein